MPEVFYPAAALAIASTVMTITRLKVVHALLYMVVSLLASAVMFAALGAPFVAALEVMVYAGAIMVVFVFVVMMLNMGDDTLLQEKKWLTPGMWVVPGIFCAVLLALLVYVMTQGNHAQPLAVQTIDAKQVGITLYGPYLLAVED